MDEQIKIFSGVNEIVGNGVALVDDEKPMIIHYQDLIYVFKYIKDAASEPKLRTKIEENQCIIELVNFSETIGQGITDPMEIGVYGGRKILLALWNEPLTSEADRKITWQLLLEPKN